MSKEMSKSFTWYEYYIEGETSSSEACSDRMAYKQNEEVVYDAYYCGRLQTAGGLLKVIILFCFRKTT